MRYYAVALAVVLAVALVVPAQAAEAGDQKCETKCKKIVVKTGGDEKLVALAEAEGCKVITISKDGEEKVIKLKGDKLLDFDDKLDTDTRLKLLDAKIAHLKATGQLKTDLAVKRAEAEKLKLAKKSDADVAAKKKEVEALKVRLEDAKQAYKKKVQKLVPGDMAELYILGCCDESDMIQLGVDLGTGMSKRIMKCIQLEVDEEEGD